MLSEEERERSRPAYRGFITRGSGQKENDRGSRSFSTIGKEENASSQPEADPKAARMARAMRGKAADVPKEDTKAKKASASTAKTSPDRVKSGSFLYSSNQQNDHAQVPRFNPGDFFAYVYCCQYSYGCHNISSTTCTTCGKRCCKSHMSSYTVTYGNSRVFFCLDCGEEAAPSSFFGMLNSLVAKIFMLGVGMLCIVGGVDDFMQRGVRDFNGYFAIFFGLLWVWPVIRANKFSK